MAATADWATWHRPSPPVGGIGKYQAGNSTPKMQALRSNCFLCKIIAISDILPMGTVTYTKKAMIKGPKKMPRHHADNLRSAFERIAAGDSQDLDIKAPQGREGFRLRSGDYRTIYEIDGE